MSTVHDDSAAWSDEELDTALDDLLNAGLNPGHHAEARSSQPVPGVGDRRRVRWPLPVAAAAAVIATAVGVATLIADHQRAQAIRTAAATVAIENGIADVGGVRFPVPAGWTVSARLQEDMVVACAAAAPTGNCDGVTISIAIPDGPPLPNAVENAVIDQNCQPDDGRFIKVDTTPALGERAAIHYWGSCFLGGYEAHLWLLLDRSLAVSTPAGEWADEGARIARGIDLRQWSRQPGPQLVQWAEASTAVESTAGR